MKQELIVVRVELHAIDGKLTEVTEIGRIDVLSDGRVDADTDTYAVRRFRRGSDQVVQLEGRTHARRHGSSIWALVAKAIESVRL